MMTTLTLDLNKKVTKTEMSLAQKLQVAALTKDTKEVERLLKDPVVKKLFKRGVLRTGRTVLSFLGDLDRELG